MNKLTKNKSDILLNSIKIEDLSLNQIKEILSSHIDENNLLKKELNSLKKSNNHLKIIFANIKNLKLSDSEFRDFCKSFLD